MISQEQLNSYTQFFDYDLHLDNREIFIKEITDETAEVVLKGLSILSTLPGKDTLFTINSPGGAVYAGLAIYDAIKSCPTHTVIYGTGYVMSIASVIFQAADIRAITPTTSFMLHYGCTGADDATHSQDFIKDAQEELRLNKLIENIYLEKIRAKHPKFTLRALREKMKFNWYLSAQEVVKWGLADAVVEDINEIRAVIGS
jgi:ATP-dependent Clp protease protease subunit